MMQGLLKSLALVSVNVTDWQRSRKFYEETLGLPIAAFLNDEVGWVQYGEKDGTQLAIGLWRGPGSMPKGDGNAIPIFSVDDCAQAAAELRRRGVKVDEPINVPGMVTYANFYDPDGNRLQLAGPPGNM